MTYYGGLQPVRPGSIKFKYSAYVESTPLPKSFGHISNKTVWGMLGNDRAGCCVVAGAAHETMLWTKASRRPDAPFTDGNVLREYMQASGWNGKRDDPSDIGLDMQKFAERRRTLGVRDTRGIRHKIKAYAELENVHEVLQAAYLFGAAGVGVRIPSSAQKQFEEHKPWVVVPGDVRLFGHYISCVGRNSVGHFVFVTWGRLQAATPEWVDAYMMQGVAYLSQEYLKDNGQTPELLDEAKLDSHLAALGS